jgi:hypothetical protein
LKPGRGRLRGFLLLAALGAGALLLLRVALHRPATVTGEAPRDGWVRVPAVLHVHTTHSDGGGTPDEVIRAARDTGVAVLGIADHNNLDAKPFEGYRDGVLVLVGSELSTPSGHVLGVGLERDPAFRFNGDGLDALDDVRHLGGLAFAAHPLSPRADLRFTGFELPGPWGLELLNGDSDARRAGPRLLLTAFLYRLNPDYALLSAASSVDAVLERWDALLARRDVVGLAGSDAHSRIAITRTRALRFPSYAALFRQARNHLLLAEPLRGDAAADRAAVLGALAQGRFYIGIDALAPADGFSFTVLGAGGRRFTMGDEVDPSPSLRAVVGGRMPRGVRIVLRRDGSVVGEAASGLDLSLPGPGVYRVEAWLPGWPVPWVVTNPIYVFDAVTREARRQRAAWPGPPAPPRESEPLSFATGPPFTAEHDPVSTMDGTVVEARAGPGGADAFRLGFHLAPPGPGQAFTWCALVNREARDLGGWSGLRFRIRADGEYRLWIQLRDLNPASPDEGLEWWMASARTSSEWSEVELPFARFRTLNPKSDGRLDPGQTRAVVFMLDHASVKPGTKGTIWLSDVGVYR